MTTRIDELTARRDALRDLLDRAGERSTPLCELALHHESTTHHEQEIPV